MPSNNSFSKYTTLLCLFLSSATLAKENAFYTVQGAYPAGDGARFLVVEVKDEVTGNSARYPVVVKVNKDGSFDEAFGDKGALSLKDHEGWSQTTIKDIKVGPDGKLKILGELCEREAATSPSMPVRTWADVGTVQDGLVVLDFLILRAKLGREGAGKARYAPGKEATLKVFVSSYDAKGKLDTSFAEGTGTAIVHNVLEHPSDSANGLLIGKDGSVFFSAQQSYDPDKFVPIVGKLKPSGILDTEFGKKGLTKIDTVHLSKKRRAEFHGDGLSQKPDGTLVVQGSLTLFEPSTRRIITVDVSENGKNVLEPVVNVRVNEEKTQLGNFSSVYDHDTGVGWLIATTDRRERTYIRRYTKGPGGKIITLSSIDSNTHPVLNNMTIETAELLPDGGVELVIRSKADRTKMEVINVSPDGKQATKVHEYRDIYSAYRHPVFGFTVNNCSSRARKIAGATE